MSSGQQENHQKTLEELDKQTAKTMADARKQVDRARKTLHDQLLPPAHSDLERDFESGDSEDEDYEDRESGPDKDDTRGAWPNWT